MDALPTDCLVHVFSFLSMAVVARLALVCRSFADAARTSICSRKRLSLFIGVRHAADDMRDEARLTVADLDDACVDQEEARLIGGPRFLRWCLADELGSRGDDCIRWTRGCRQLLQRLRLTFLEIEMISHVQGPFCDLPCPSASLETAVDVTDLVMEHAASLTELFFLYKSKLQWTTTVMLPNLQRLTLNELVAGIDTACPMLCQLFILMDLNVTPLPSGTCFPRLQRLRVVSFTADRAAACPALQHVDALTFESEALLLLNPDIMQSITTEKQQTSNMKIRKINGQILSRFRHLQSFSGRLGRKQLQALNPDSLQQLDIHAHSSIRPSSLKRFTKLRVVFTHKQSLFNPPHVMRTERVTELLPVLPPLYGLCFTTMYAPDSKADVVRLVCDAQPGLRWLRIHIGSHVSSLQDLLQPLTRLHQLHTLWLFCAASLDVRDVRLSLQQLLRHCPLKRFHITTHPLDLKTAQRRAYQSDVFQESVMNEMVRDVARQTGSDVQYLSVYDMITKASIPLSFQ